MPKNSLSKTIAYFVGVSISCLALSLPVRSQNLPACPNKPGVYVIQAGHWTELQMAKARAVKLRARLPFHDKVTAIYAGGSALAALTSDSVLCASGVPLGGVFSLARAKVSKKDRQVGIGNETAFTFAVDFEVDKNQAVPIVQSQSSDGIFSIHLSSLASGQYLLYLKQGTSFAAPPVAFDFYVP